MKRNDIKDLILSGARRNRVIAASRRCESACNAAEKIGRLSINAVSAVTAKSRVHAFLEGADPDVWMDTFWQTVGLVQAARAALNMGEKL